jgi:hypothetical protein
MAEPRREEVMKYSLTLENLRAIPTLQLPHVMWEYYLAYSRQVGCDLASSNRSFSAAERRAFDLGLPRGLRLVHSIVRFDGDILNGGIWQYVGNHTPDDNPEQVFEDLDALKAIGAVESAAILEETISVYTRDYGWPLGTGEQCRYDLYDHPDLIRLDAQRCNNESSFRDYAILAEYLGQHLDECILPVEVEIEPEFILPRLAWSASDPE